MFVAFFETLIDTQALEVGLKSYEIKHAVKEII